MNVAEIRAQARKEVADALLRELIEQEKVRLRTYRSLWDRLFPFTITIRRKK